MNKYTSKQLAEFLLPSYPTTPMGWDKLLAREGWEFVEEHGRGRGGKRREYIPPPEIQTLIDARLAGEPLPEPVNLPAQQSENALFWEIKLENLKKRLGVESDAKIAAWLGVSRQTLHAARSGKAPLPISAKIKIMDRVGYFKTQDALLNLLPSKIRDQLTEMDNEFVRKKIRSAADDEIKSFKNELHKFQSNGWSEDELIALVKEIFTTQNNGG